MKYEEQFPIYAVMDEHMEAQVRIHRPQRQEPRDQK